MVDRDPQRRRQLRLPHAGRRAQDLDADGAPDRRHERQQAPHGLRHAPYPHAQRVGEPGGQLGAGRVQPRGQQLLGEQRVAAAALVDLVDQVVLGRLAEDALQLLGDPGAVQRPQLRQRHAVVVLELGEHLAHRMVGRQLAGAVGDHRGDPLGAQRAHEEADEVLRRAVHPVEVLEHDQDRRAAAEHAEQEDERLVEPRLGVPVGLCLAGHRHAGRQVRERAHELGADLGPELLQRGREVGRRDATERGGQRRVGELAAVELDAVAAQHDRALLLRPALGLAHQPRLADPGLPDQQRHRRRARRGASQQVVEHVELRLALDDAAAGDAGAHWVKYPPLP